MRALFFFIVVVVTSSSGRRLRRRTASVAWPFDVVRLTDRWSTAFPRTFLSAILRVVLVKVQLLEHVSLSVGVAGVHVAAAV